MLSTLAHKPKLPNVYGYVFMHTLLRVRAGLTRYADTVGCRYIVVILIVVWGIWVSFPPSGWARMDIQTEVGPPGFEDGCELKITEEAVTLCEPTDSGHEQRIRWSIPAKKAYHSLFFETFEGVQCLFYLTPEPDKRIGMHALALRDGHAVWDSVLTLGATLDQPTKPVFVAPWIYLGRGTWLERVNPEDGTIIQRYPMREIIQEVYASSDGSLEVVVETFDAGQISIRFQDGEWFPHIDASSSLAGSSLLMNRAMMVMPDFAGTLDPSNYQGYLDLHRIKKKTTSSEDIVTWRNFDPARAESAYATAVTHDPANPYLSLFLALAQYYQGPQQAATVTMDDALQRSAEFWEESLRLGAICDSLGHSAWADAFYEQGMALYFREVPAPSQEISLDEVLAVFLQQQSSALFANGYTDRALRLLDVRREIFPYTEGDNHFSRRYADWLRQNGQPDRARQEEDRIGKHKLVFDRLAISPLSAWNVGAMAMLFIVLLVLKNDIQHWSELLILLVIIALLDSVATLDLLGSLNLPARALAHVVGLGGYVALVAWRRHRKARASISLRKMLIVVAISSYVVLLRGTLPAYYVGFYLTQSQVGAKCAEVLFIVLFLGTYILLRRRLSFPPMLRYRRLLVLGLIVYVCWAAWLHQWGSLSIITMNFPQPWADKGHPNWVAYIDERVEDADFRKQDVQFLQALVHHIRGDFDIAEQLYLSLRPDARVLNNLGVLVSEHDREAAIAYFQRALEQDAEFPPARYNLGVLTGDRSAIEEARAADAWIPSMYQRYAPERLWIANPDLDEWCRILYWSRGGFLYKSFLELMVRFTNPAELFQSDLQQLR